MVQFRKIMLIAVATCMLTACEKSIESDATAKQDAQETTLPDGTVAKTKKFTFTLKGDFTSEWKPVTRANEYLSADGKEMTDVWVLDYMGGTLIQQLHQTNTDEDFGAPTLNLAYGSHHVYIIASRGTGAVLDTENHTITFAKSLDTFYKDYSVDVVATSNGNRAVTLDRVVTKLKLVFSDAIPADAATFNITPATWYYAWDYVNGAPTGAATDQTVTLNIPSASIGVVNKSVNLYGFSTSAEWTTNVAFNCKKTGGDVLGDATLSDVPFKANRVSEFTGPLFGSGGTMTLSLDTEWDSAYEGTW